MPANDAFSSAGVFDKSNVVLPNPSVIVAAATIAPVKQLTRLTGTVPVATITPPNPYFTGPLYLLSTDASPFTTVTTGNIALATTVVRFKVLVLVYDPGVKAWYPSY